MANNRLSILSDLLTGAMRQDPGQVGRFLGSLDNATAARLIAAAEAGDNRAILKAMSEAQIWGGKPKAAPPAAPSGGRDPVSFEDRLAANTGIRQGLEDVGVSTQGMSQAEVLEAAAEAFRRDGAPRGRPKRPEDAIRELAKPADQVAAESVAKQFYRSPGTDDFIPDAPPIAAAKPETREWSDEARAASAIAAGTGAAFALDAAASRLVGGGNPAELDDAPVSGSDVTWDIYDRPDPFEPAPAEPVRVGNKYFHQDYFDYQPFGFMPEEAIGKPIKLGTPARKPADLTESGNPADLKVNLSQPQLVTSGRSAPTGAMPAPSVAPQASPAPEPSRPVAAKPASKTSAGPTTDFSGTPDDKMEYIMGLLKNNPEFIPNVDERKAFVAEYFRRQRAGSAQAPNVAAKLEAADTPMVADEEVKAMGLPPLFVPPRDLRAAGGAPAQTRPPIIPPRDQPVYNGSLRDPTPDGDIAQATNPQAELYQDLINRGHSREQAMLILAERDPGIRGLLAGAQSPAEARDARLAAFERRDAEARGLNYRGPAAPQSTVTVDGLTLPSVLGSDGQPLGDGQYYTEGSRRAAERARAAAITRAGGPRGVPGPRTNDGRLPTPAPEFTTPEEAEAYYTRSTDPETGSLLPSPADLAMERRGFAFTYGDDGEAHYQMGFPLLRGAGQDVRRNLQQYTNHRVPGTKDAAWQMESKDGPTGTFEALVPTQALRDYNATQAKRASLLRNAARGSSRAMQDLKAMGDLTPAEEVRLNNMLTERNRAARFADMARLAGGSQGLRGGAGGNVGMFQALAMLEGKDPQHLDARNRALMYSLPGGREAAAVDAQNTANAFEIAQRQNTGRFAGQGVNPLEDAQATAQRLANDNALRQSRESDEAMLAHQYAPEQWRPWWLGGNVFDEFTEDEQQDMYDTLIRRGYDEADAEAAVIKQATLRRATKRWRRPTA